MTIKIQGNYGLGQKVIRPDIEKEFTDFFNDQHGTTYDFTGREGTKCHVEEWGKPLGNKDPPITATIIYYNEQCYIYACLDALRENISEFILIDGRYEGFRPELETWNSDDKTNEHIMEFFMEFSKMGWNPRVRWLHSWKPWKSQVEKRNVQWDLVLEGEWILGLDADEITSFKSWEEFWTHNPLKTESEKEYWFVKFWEVLNDMQTHDHWRFHKNVNGIHHKHNHWSFANNDGDIKGNLPQLEHTLEYFNIWHLSHSRPKERTDWKVTNLAWRREHNVDIPKDFGKKIPQPEDLWNLDVEKITWKKGWQAEEREDE